ncbi:MAG: NUDIX domain-containing protein [Candidatus Microsaccharimonas sp.]
MQVVGAIIKNHHEEYLLQLRDDRAPTFKNKWTLFGGRVEDGEEPEEALLRELNEELAIPQDSIESLKEVQVNDDPNGTRQHIYEVLTGIAISQLVLGEGAEMKYVPRDQLFEREFAFNIEEVFKTYLAHL